MGTVAKALGSKIRVFRWDINQPQEGEESSSSALEYLGGIFLIRLRTTFSTQFQSGVDQVEDRDQEIFFPKTSLQNLKYFGTARKLIGDALKQLPNLDSCGNRAVIAGSLAADLLFKFNFGPEILSGKGPVPVIFLRLEVKLQSKKPNLPGSVDIPAKNFPGNIYGSIYLGSDMRIKQIRRMCRELCYEGGRNHDDDDDGDKKLPLGFEEVKADLEIKYFEDGIAGDDPEGNQCRICFETFSEGTMIVETSCSYRFHKRCMYEWLLSSSSCPMCGSNCTVNV